MIRSIIYTIVGIMYPFLENADDWMRFSTPTTEDINLGDDFLIDTDVVDFFGSERGGHDFMGKFSVADVTRIIKEGPVGKQLEKVGLDEWRVEFDLSDPFNHYVYVRSPKFKEKDQYICFLIVRVDQILLKVSAHSPNGLAFINENMNIAKWNVLNIQWLSLQNPGKSFTAERPRLPGQRYPGSGIGRAVLSEIKKYSKMAKRDGVMNIPEQFHNAVMYRGFYFIDPYNQAMFNRMLVDLAHEIKDRGLAAVSWAVGAGGLRLEGKIVQWNLGEQIYPLSMKALSYFNSSHYTDTVVEHELALSKFTIDWDGVGRELILDDGSRN